MNILIPTFEDTMRYGRVRFGRVHSHDHAHAECALEGQASGHSRGLLGVRGAMMAKAGGGGVPTMADYVQTNLKAAWDGIENDGRGNPHNASATVWTEWVEGIVNPPVGNGVWVNGNALDTSAGAFSYWGYQSTPTLVRDFPTGQDVTVEVVVAVNSYSADSNSKVFFSICGAHGLYTCGYKGQTRVGFDIGWSSLGAGLDDIPTSTPTVISAAFSYNGTNYSTSVYRNGNFEENRTRDTAPYNDNSWYMLYPAEADVKLMATRWYGGKALTAAEVAANYAVDKARFNIT